MATGRVPVEHRVLDATRSCVERWGYAKLTVDDVAAAAGVSRATIYRLFPGGKEVLFEAVRVRELEEFFADLRAATHLATSLPEVLIGAVVTASQRLRDDEHLSLMLAAEPGETLSQLTSAGVPRIIRFATAFLVPLLDPYLPRDAARTVVEVLSRLTISYYLAPSDTVDLADEAAATRFLTPIIDVLTAPVITAHSDGRSDSCSWGDQP